MHDGVGRGQDEIDGVRRIEMALKLAYFPDVKEPASFDFLGAAVDRSKADP